MNVKQSFLITAFALSVFSAPLFSMEAEDPELAGLVDHPHEFRDALISPEIAEGRASARASGALTNFYESEFSKIATIQNGRTKRRFDDDDKEEEATSKRLDKKGRNFRPPSQAHATRQWSASPFHAPRSPFGHTGHRSAPLFARSPAPPFGMQRPPSVPPFGVPFAPPHVHRPPVMRSFGPPAAHRFGRLPVPPGTFNFMQRGKQSPFGSRPQSAPPAAFAPSPIPHEAEVAAVDMLAEMSEPAERHRSSFVQRHIRSASPAFIEDVAAEQFATDMEEA